MKINFKENKGTSNSVFIMLVVFIAILICFIVYLIKNPMQKVVEKEVAVTTTETNTALSVKLPTYKDLKGKYTYKVERTSTDQPELTYELYLNDDGTFCFEYLTDAAFGYMGNYIINENEIILNKLFEHDSGVGLYLKKEKVNLEVNYNGTLTISSGEEKGTFTKVSNDITDEATFFDMLKGTIDIQKNDKEIYFFD